MVLDNNPSLAGARVDKREWYPILQAACGPFTALDVCAVRAEWNAWWTEWGEVEAERARVALDIFPGEERESAPDSITDPAGYLRAVRASGRALAGHLHYHPVDWSEVAAGFLAGRSVREVRAAWEERCVVDHLSVCVPCGCVD